MPVKTTVTASSRLNTRKQIKIRYDRQLLAKFPAAAVWSIDSTGAIVDVDACLQMKENYCSHYHSAHYVACGQFITQQLLCCTAWYIRIIFVIQALGLAYSADTYTG